MQLAASLREEGMRSLSAKVAKWYAIHTRCQHEFIIWNHLKKKAVEKFFPCVYQMEPSQGPQAEDPYSTLPGLSLCPNRFSSAPLAAGLKD